MACDKGGKEVKRKYEGKVKTFRIAMKRYSCLKDFQQPRCIAFICSLNHISKHQCHSVMYIKSNYKKVNLLRRL